MLAKLKAFWRGLPDGLRRAIHTAWQTFIAIFIAGLVPVVQQVIGGDYSAAQTALAALFVAAVASALSSFKAALIIYLRR